MGREQSGSLARGRAPEVDLCAAYHAWPVCCTSLSSARDWHAALIFLSVVALRHIVPSSRDTREYLQHAQRPQRAVSGNASAQCAHEGLGIGREWCASYHSPCPVLPKRAAVL
jgi:hypothetical protein